MLSKIQSLKFNALPPLAESSVLRYITFSILYIAQGIPYGLLWFAFPAWMAMNMKSPGEIAGFIAVLGLPWSFKVINAPFMDRFTYLAMGRRRAWILIGQGGIIISLICMSFIPDPLNNIFLLMVLGFINSFFTVIQDIAVDGLAVDILPAEQQARANGVMWGSKVLGKSLTVVAASWLLNNYGFSYTLIFFSLIVSLIFFIPIFLRERKGEKILPWTEGNASQTAASLQLYSFKSIFKNLFKVFFLPVSLLMGIAAFNSAIGEGLMDAILPVFTVQRLGWTNEDYSQVFGAANIIAGGAGMFIGGALTDFLGKVRMMTFYLGSMALIVSIFSFLNNFWINEEFVTAYIIIFYILLTFNSIAIFASAMKLCSKTIAATQFALYMAVSNLGLAAGSGLMGLLKNFLTWEYVITAYIPFSLIALTLVRFVNFDKHQKGLDEMNQTSAVVPD